MQMEEEIVLVNKKNQDHNLKIGVQKNEWKWWENVDAGKWSIFYFLDMHFLTVW